MSDSNRRHFAKLAGLAAVSLIGLVSARAPLPQPEEQRDTTQNGSGNTGEEIADPALVLSADQVIASPSPTPDLPDTASDQAYYTAEDLKAQRVMAWWTRIMGLAAITGVLLSALGIWLIYSTFKATLWAARYSGVAARQSRRSLEHIKQTTAKQLRPYVAITESSDIDRKPFSRESELRFRVKNFGQTPATNVRLSIGERAAKEPIKNLEIELGDKWGDYGLIAPADSRREIIHTRDMQLDDLADIAKGDIKLIIRLRIDYTWPDGSDFHDIAMILSDPTTNKWTLLDERRRKVGGGE